MKRDDVLGVYDVNTKINYKEKERQAMSIRKEEEVNEEEIIPGLGHTKEECMVCDKREICQATKRAIMKTLRGMSPTDVHSRVVEAERGATTDWATMEDFFYDMFRFPKQSYRLEYFEKLFGHLTPKEMNKELQAIYISIDENPIDAMIRLYRAQANPDKKEDLEGLGKYNAEEGVDFAQAIGISEEDKGTISTGLNLWWAAKAEAFRGILFEAMPDHLKNIYGYQILIGMYNRLYVQTEESLAAVIPLPPK